MTIIKEGIWNDYYQKSQEGIKEEDDNARSDVNITGF